MTASGLPACRLNIPEGIKTMVEKEGRERGSRKKEALERQTRSACITLAHANRAIGDGKRSGDLQLA